MFILYTFFLLKQTNSILVYPPKAKGAITITRADMARLEPNEFLNDVIINFYLKYLETVTIASRPRRVGHRWVRLEQLLLSSALACLCLLLLPVTAR